jgi:hypothetical protein
LACGLEGDGYLVRRARRAVGLVLQRCPLPFLFACVFMWNRDTSKRPAKVTNPIGTLLLGHIEPDGKGGENLDTGELIELSHVIRFLYGTSLSA